MSRLRILLALLFAACLLAPAGAQQFRQPPPYRILVTNDDGVRAPGIAAVAQALQAIGTPIIVGPAENQTGKGHSIITSETVFREDLTLPNGLPAIGLTATPASVVNIAIRNIVMPRPDLVVSGVNTEYNLGLSTQVSGTVGAAREAARHGIPGDCGLDVGRGVSEGAGVRGRRGRVGGPPRQAVGPAAEHLPQRQHSRRCRRAATRAT